LRQTERFEKWFQVCGRDTCCVMPNHRHEQFSV